MRAFFLRASEPALLREDARGTSFSASREVARRGTFPSAKYKTRNERHYYGV